MNPKVVIILSPVGQNSTTTCCTQTQLMVWFSLWHVIRMVRKDWSVDHYFIVASINFKQILWETHGFTPNLTNETICLQACIIGNSFAQFRIERLTTSRKSAFICLSSTTTLAATAVVFVDGPLVVATIISVSKSCINIQETTISEKNHYTVWRFQIRS